MKRFFGILFLLVVSISLVVTGSPAPASAQTTIYVNASNTGDPLEDGTAAHPFDEIQEGIGAAVSGDTVQVASGTYYENINFLGKAITVRSDSGAENTIIDGSGVGSVVTFESGEGLDSVLDAFMITNAGGLNNHGIRCYQGSATIINNIITDNAGCGISLYKSISVIKNNIIYGNPEFDPVPFDAINLLESSPEIEGNTILATDLNGNISAIEIDDSDGGLPQSFLISSNIIKGRIFVSVRSPISTFENQISNNIIIIENLFSEAINVNIQDEATLLIVNNVVHKGGGIFLQRGGDKTRIINNIITESDIGIESWSGYLEILNNDLWANVQNYDDIPDQTGINGNISADPMFVDLGSGDYHLRAQSPCIDAGTSNAPLLPDLDFEGDSRFIGVAPDIGADEFRNLAMPWIPLLLLNE